MIIIRNECVYFSESPGSPWIHGMKYEIQQILGPISNPEKMEQNEQETRILLKDEIIFHVQVMSAEVVRYYHESTFIYFMRFYLPKNRNFQIGNEFCCLFREICFHHKNGNILLRVCDNTKAVFVVPLHTQLSIVLL